MKKTAILILAFCLLLAGCGGNNGDDNAAESSYGGVDCSFPPPGVTFDSYQNYDGFFDIAALRKELQNREDGDTSISETEEIVYEYKIKEAFGRGIVDTRGMLWTVKEFKEMLESIDGWEIIYPKYDYLDPPEIYYNYTKKEFDATFELEYSDIYCLEYFIGSKDSLSRTLTSEYWETVGTVDILDQSQALYKHKKDNSYRLKYDMGDLTACITFDVKGEPLKDEDEMNRELGKLELQKTTFRELTAVQLLK